jgi:hypothetical protein
MFFCSSGLTLQWAGGVKQEEEQDGGQKADGKPPHHMAACPEQDEPAKQVAFEQETLGSG